MADAYIVDAVRTPTGKRRGGLSDVHGADLGAHVLKAIVERNGIPEVDYDDVIFGCLDTIGPLAGDIARTCWLAAGLARRCRAPPWIASAAPPSRPCTSLPRRSWPASTMW